MNNHNLRGAATPAASAGGLNMTFVDTGCGDRVDMWFLEMCARVTRPAPPSCRGKIQVHEAIMVHFNTTEWTREMILIAVSKPDPFLRGAALCDLKKRSIGGDKTRVEDVITVLQIESQRQRHVGSYWRWSKLRRPEKA